MLIVCLKQMILIKIGSTKGLQRSKTSISASNVIINAKKFNLSIKNYYWINFALLEKEADEPG